MNDPSTIYLTAILLGAVGLWLMLPRPQIAVRMAGAVFGAAALGLVASQVPLLGGWVAQGVFAVLAGVTVVSAVATVTLRNPVYAAIWFGMTLLGTAGLFLYQGAQFLAVATIVVYAGAILVTFLFVLMLADPRGRAPYDRVAWEPMVSAAAGAVIVGVLSMTLTGVLVSGNGPPGGAEIAAADRAAGVLAEEHVARLGGELFGRHLVGVEVAGTLLLAALVGAAIIVAQMNVPQKKPDNP